jgi:hypothetical protein
MALLCPPSQNRIFFLISVPGRVILWADHQTTTLFRALVDSLDDVNQLLLVLQNPIQLVVVTSPEIAHHVFVAKEEHDGHRVVELVHLLKVGHLVQVAEVDDGEVLDALSDAVEDFVLSHAVRVAVSSKADDHEALFLGENGLVDMPAGAEMREDNRAHDGSLSQYWLYVCTLGAFSGECGDVLYTYRVCGE